MEIHDDKVFEEVNYTQKVVRATEYNNCIFRKCDFADSSFLQCKFIECVFEDCNLSLIKLEKTTITDAVFKSCKLLGVNFSPTEDFLFSVKFESCILDYASFMGKKMPKTTFSKSTLKETTFSQANISGSVFDQCDLSGTVFSYTDLSSVNFSTSFNYIIDPEMNTMKRAVFSADGLPGLLDKYGIRIV